MEQENQEVIEIEPVHPADRWPEEMLDNVFSYHAPKNGQGEKYIVLRAKAKELAELINLIVPKGPEKDNAFSDIQTAVMWANAGISRN